MTDRDHYPEDPLDRIEELERRVRDLERLLARAVLVTEADTEGATEEAYYGVRSPGGGTGYVRIYDAK